MGFDSNNEIGDEKIKSKYEIANALNNSIDRVHQNLITKKLSAQNIYHRFVPMEIHGDTTAHLRLKKLPSKGLPSGTCTELGKRFLDSNCQSVLELSKNNFCQLFRKVVNYHSCISRIVMEQLGNRVAGKMTTFLLRKVIYNHYN